MDVREERTQLSDFSFRYIECILELKENIVLLTPQVMWGHLPLVLGRSHDKRKSFLEERACRCN